ncbi:hypothetical protein M6B38_205640 [Iris pallida]|uniref:Secreted protein n=1 Tax=Iris pallida TaxID=29817 RepID=A0AAX6E8D9_IRIPA|nr:hypothetical protein M6B38_205640 [Iris pallida]
MMVMFLLLPPLPCWVRSHGRPPNSIKFTFLCALGEIARAFLNFCPDSPPIVWCCAVCAFFSSFFFQSLYRKPTYMVCYYNNNRSLHNLISLLHNPISPEEPTGMVCC